MFKNDVQKTLIGRVFAQWEAPPRERDLASELRIAKMHNRQMFEYYCTLKQLATLVRENLQDNVYI